MAGSDGDPAAGVRGDVEEGGGDVVVVVEPAEEGGGDDITAVGQRQNVVPSTETVDGDLGVGGGQGHRGGGGETVATATWGRNLEFRR